MLAGGIALAFGFFIPRVLAASLYLSPGTKTLAVGQTFTVALEVSSADQAMNAVSADISFPSDKLRALSVSQTNSVINLWVQSPSFSNAQGTGDVLLQGVVLSPGFSGAAGDVLRITFQAMAQGVAPVSFSSGSVLANDGKGTNILTSMSGASFTIGPASAVTPSPAAAQISGIVVTSAPSTEDDTWYSLNSIQFNWNMPIGADGVWYVLASSSNMTPPVTAVASQKTNVSYDLSSLSDGIWYFLISAEENGVWSPVVTKTLRLDRTPPEPFTITRTDSDPADTELTFTWATTDALSGLSHYEVKIGDGDWFDPETLRQGSSYVIPQSTPSERSLAVRAIDNAGNVREEDTTFRVVAPNSWQEWWYQVMRFFSFSIIVLALIVAAFILIYYLLSWRFLVWKRKTKRELREFAKELHEEIGKMESEEKKKKENALNIDLRPSILEREKGSIEKEAERLKEETETKIEKIKKLTGDK